MKRLEIESLEELNSIFREKSVDMTNTIREAIQETFDKKKKTALLFEISVEGLENYFEISLHSKEWLVALENCLKHYEEWGMSDEAIDTWQLIQKIKQWKN